MSQQTHKSKQSATVEDPQRLTASAVVLRIEDVAAMLRITPRHLGQLRKDEDFPVPFFVGKRPRWHRTKIEEWMDQGGSSHS